MWAGKKGRGRRQQRPEQTGSRTSHSGGGICSDDENSFSKEVLHREGMFQKGHCSGWWLLGNDIGEKLESERLVRGQSEKTSVLNQYREGGGSGGF